MSITFPVRPDLAFLDFTQTLLGPALALRRSGLAVHYFDGVRDPARIPGYRKVLLESCFGAVAVEPCFTARRIIYSESFSDAWWALQEGQQTDAPIVIEDPFAASIHPLQVDLRLEQLQPRLETVDDLVVVDMSDLAVPLHPKFLELPGTKLKREIAPSAATELGITPYPFLYNPVLLTLDYAWGLDACTPDARTPLRDGWFCGTIGHARYGGRRKSALQAIVARHPGARFAIHDGDVPTLENLREVQRSRTVLHPPGRGTICFRTHEALRFGVPMLVEQRPQIALPELLQASFITELTDAEEASAAAVRCYQECYSPEAAGRLLQDHGHAPTYTYPFTEPRT